MNTTLIALYSLLFMTSHAIKATGTWIILKAYWKSAQFVFKVLFQLYTKYTSISIYLIGLVFVLVVFLQLQLQRVSMLYKCNRKHSVITCKIHKLTFRTQNHMQHTSKDLGQGHVCHCKSFHRFSGWKVWTAGRPVQHPVFYWSNKCSMFFSIVLLKNVSTSHIYFRVDRIAQWLHETICCFKTCIYCAFQHWWYFIQICKLLVSRQ